MVFNMYIRIEIARKTRFEVCVFYTDAANEEQQQQQQQQRLRMRSQS